MATVSAVRSALAARLATISGVTAYATAPGSVNAPAALVELGDPVAVYDDDFDGDVALRFNVLLLVGFADLGAAQAALDPYIDATGASSVRAAIAADQTLGGTVAYARVASAGGYGTFAYNDIAYLGLRFAVEVG